MQTSSFGLHANNYTDFDLDLEVLNPHLTCLLSPEELHGRRIPLRRRPVYLFFIRLRRRRWLLRQQRRGLLSQAHLYSWLFPVQQHGVYSAALGLRWRRRLRRWIRRVDWALWQETDTKPLRRTRVSVQQRRVHPQHMALRRRLRLQRPLRWSELQWVKVLNSNALWN